MNEQNQEQKKPAIEALTDFIIKIKPYARNLKNNRKQLLVVNGSVCVLAVLYLFLVVKPYYQSTITILPDFGNKTSDMLSQYAGLAAMAGVNVGGDVSTQVYQNLLSSETVLSNVIYRKYNTKEFIQPVNLIEYFEIKPDESLPDSLQKRKMFLKVLESMIKSRTNVTYDAKTKIITATVEMPESQLSADVANARGSAGNSAGIISGEQYSGGQYSGGRGSRRAARHAQNFH